MAKDWLTTYFAARNKGEEFRRIDFRTTELAASAAPAFFKRLAAQVQQDVAEYGRATGRQILNYQWAAFSGSAGAFVVARRNAYPYVHLEVTLRDMFVVFDRTIRMDAGDNKGEDSGMIRITSDLQGQASAAIDGGPNCDASDISEFLLRPVLDALEKS